MTQKYVDNFYCLVLINLICLSMPKLYEDCLTWMMCVPMDRITSLLWCPPCITVWGELSH